MRTPEQALAYARRFTTCKVGMCLWHVQDWFGSPHKYPDAHSQANAVRLYQGTPPPGVPVFYRGGKHGHVAISTGNGNIRSTDCPSDGRVGETDLNWPQRRWGHVYIGWSKNIGGVDIPGIGSGGSGSSSGAITKNIHSEKLGMGEPTNGDADSNTVKELQRKLNGIKLVGGTTLPITGHYGSLTDAEVRKWQEQVCGDTPDPAGRSYLGKRQRERMFPASEGYTIHDNGLPKIANQPVEPETPPPSNGVPACPPMTDFKPGASNPAFTWMGERFLVWLTAAEIAKEGPVYTPGPRFSTCDEQNIRKCQIKMGDTPDSPGSAFFGPRQWARLADAPPGGGTDGGDSSGGDVAPPPVPPAVDRPAAPSLIYPQAEWDPIAKKGGGWITGLRKFSGTARKITIHVTETKVKPNWVQQQTGIPHFTVDLKSGTCWQHLPLDMAAYTLRGPDNISGQSPNADSGINIQIEVIGYSADVRRWSDDEYDDLSMLCSWICDVTGVPFVCPLPFAEAGSARRLGWSEWAGTSGIVGHEHAPHNEHTDPGALDASRLIEGLEPPQPDPEPSFPTWLAEFINKHWIPILVIGTGVLLILAMLFGL